MWDSGIDDADRILIFGPNLTGDWVNQVQQIYVCGTFSLVPSLFGQIYVILATRIEFVLPII